MACWILYQSPDPDSEFIPDGKAIYMMECNDLLDCSMIDISLHQAQLYLLI